MQTQQSRVPGTGDATESAVMLPVEVERGPTRESVAERIAITLDACASNRRGHALNELVQETGLAKSTVHRMCRMMVELGLLEHSPDGFAVGSKLFTLANANPAIKDLRMAAIPHLVELQQASGAGVNLAILSDDMALVLDGLFTRDWKLPRAIGYGLPLHCTAVGKAIAARLDPQEAERLLFSRGRQPALTKRTVVEAASLRSQLERIRETGVAVANEEFLPGIKSVAAGFKLGGGGTAAIGCVDAWNSQHLRHAPDLVVAAATALEREMSAKTVD